MIKILLWCLGFGLRRMVVQEKITQQEANRIEKAAKAIGDIYKRAAAGKKPATEHLEAVARTTGHSDPMNRSGQSTAMGDR